MRLIGEVKYGKYADNFDEIHPDILDRYGDEGEASTFPRPTAQIFSR